MKIGIGQRDRCVLIAPTFDFIIYIELRPVYRGTNLAIPNLQFTNFVGVGRRRIRNNYSSMHDGRSMEITIMEISGAMCNPMNN